MEESAVNRTAVNDIHPCYEIHDFKYIFTNNPSITCLLLYIFLVILSVITICGNILVIMSVIYFKQLKSPTNYLILSLALADLLVGILVYPLSMAFSLSSCMYHEELFCKIRASFDITLSTCSILHLCCISVDRYYAVCQPLTYESKITNCWVAIMILVSWVISVLIGISILIGGLDNDKCEERCFIDVFLENTVGPILSFYLPVVIMLSIYLKIFLVAQRHVRSIQSTTGVANVSKMQRKATKTLAIVLGAFLLCWTPFFLCITFAPFTYLSIPVPVIESLNWLTLANSMLNPFIYAFFYNRFRVAFKMIISGKIFQDDFDTLH